jgi:hypothetical protein
VSTGTSNHPFERSFSSLGIERYLFFSRNHCYCVVILVHHLVGVAVTPVVCFFYKDLAEVDLKPNPDEVAEVFTIPLKSLMDKQQWVYKDDHAPIFVGGPYVIWGLTGYILERFWKDILLPFNSKSGDVHFRN